MIVYNSETLYNSADVYAFYPVIATVQTDLFPLRNSRYEKSFLCVDRFGAAIDLSSAVLSASIVEFIGSAQGLNCSVSTTDMVGGRINFIINETPVPRRNRYFYSIDATFGDHTTRVAYGQVVFGGAA